MNPEYVVVCARDYCAIMLIKEKLLFLLTEQKMSSIAMDIPTLKINGNELQNLIIFLFKHERILKEYGAIKIQSSRECRLALKKRRKTVILRPTTECIIRINNDQPVYYTKKNDHANQSVQQSLPMIDEFSFWSSLPRSDGERRQLNTSLQFNKTFFSRKISRLHFDINRIPRQSLLKIGGSKVTRQCIPCVRRAHGPGAIFPLASASQRLFSLDYHHEGGAHHWYIIPSGERDALRRLFDSENPTICLDHGQLFIDPSILDKNHIRYHRIIQHPNEFIVLSAGTLAQSFTEDASWNESITFALPSWIDDGHASAPTSLCQCNITNNPVLKIIDVNLFRHELIQRYIVSHLDGTNEKKPPITTIATSNSSNTDSLSGILFLKPLLNNQN